MGYVTRGLIKIKNDRAIDEYWERFERKAKSLG